MTFARILRGRMTAALYHEGFDETVLLLRFEKWRKEVSCCVMTVVSAEHSHCFGARGTRVPGPIMTEQAVDDT
jgi:hypothetical protein